MGNKRQKMNQAVPLGNILNELLGSKKRSAVRGSDLTRVWSLWEPALGGFIAENAKPAAFKSDILLVHVNSSPWLHQLRFLKSDIIAKLNNALGEERIKDVVFKIGPLE